MAQQALAFLVATAVSCIMGMPVPAIAKRPAVGAIQLLSLPHW
jgi:hypothetical protein